ncbi:MAG TPA: hypothetical protein VF637_08000 [Sphingomicrobium sp.]
MNHDWMLRRTMYGPQIREAVLIEGKPLVVVRPMAFHRLCAAGGGLPIRIAKHAS